MAWEGYLANAAFSCRRKPELVCDSSQKASQSLSPNRPKAPNPKVQSLSTPSPHHISFLSTTSIPPPRNSSLQVPTSDPLPRTWTLAHLQTCTRCNMYTCTSTHVHTFNSFGFYAREVSTVVLTNTLLAWVFLTFALDGKCW